MKKAIFCLILSLLFCACGSTSKLADNPLIVPANFSEVPNLDNLEAITNEEKEENVSKLKELLLKSD
jgi:hypothetical protein